MKRKWKDRFIKRGLAWTLCILLVMQLVGADSLTAMADKAREILTVEAQESAGEGYHGESVCHRGDSLKGKVQQDMRLFGNGCAAGAEKLIEERKTD